MAEATERSARWWLRAAQLLVLAAIACLIATVALWDAHWLAYGAVSLVLAIATASLADGVA